MATTSIEPTDTDYPTTQATRNTNFVNKVGRAFDQFSGTFHRFYHHGEELPEEIADLFSLTILRDYNPDGSDRLIVSWA